MLSPIFPRLDKSKQIYLNFCPFLPLPAENLPRWEQGAGLRGREPGSKAGSKWKPLRYREIIQKGTPPLFAERQVPSTLIIFRTKKVEKSSPQENTIFRTKNTEKSRLGLIGKNFGKNLWENVSGEKESPPSCGKGARGAKI